MIYRDPPLDLAQIQTTIHHLYLGNLQTTIRHMYLDNLSRSKEAEGRIAVSSVALSADSIICYSCDKAGHIPRNAEG